MGRFSDSITLVKQSWSLLSKDKELMIFPFLSLFFTLLMIATFFLPPILSGGITIFTSNGVIFYIYLFLFYLVSSFIAIFFNVALLMCVDIRIKGGDPTIRDGFSKAAQRLSTILVWAIFSSTVGLVLRMLANKSGILGKIVISLIGMVWSLATFFVVPVMIFQNKGPFEAIKTSANLFKKTWGENFIGSASIGLIFMLLFLLGLIPMVIGAMSTNFNILLAMGAITGAYWLILIVVGMALNGVFQLVLYNYAVSGNISPGFSQELVRGAFRKK